MHHRMIKRRGLATAAMLALTSALGAGPSLAADLGPPFAPALPYWAGFHIGANLGGGTSTTSSSIDGSASSGNLDGIIGGGQIGYNWQTGSFVYGVEADAQATGQKATSNYASDGISFVETDSTPWFATLRGRLGYALPNRWLPYVTAGFGWVDVKSTLLASGYGTTLTTTPWDSAHTAWTIGAGLEYAFALNWSLRSEFLYMDTGDYSTNLNFFGTTVPATARVKQSIGRLGVNYRF